MPKITYYRQQLSKFLPSKEVGNLIRITKEKIKKERRFSPKYYQDRHLERILYNVLECYKKKV